MKQGEGEGGHRLVAILLFFCADDQLKLAVDGGNAAGVGPYEYLVGGLVLPGAVQEVGVLLLGLVAIVAGCVGIVKGLRARP